MLKTDQNVAGQASTAGDVIPSSKKLNSFVANFNERDIVENTPDVFANLSLRAMGHTPATALADLAGDNPLDAGASTIYHKYIATSDGANVERLILADNGKGMTLTQLNKGSRLGGGDEKKITKEDMLGFRRVGLNISSMALDKRMTILTKAQGNPVCICVIDLDESLARGKDIKVIREANKQETSQFEMFMNPKKITNGTMVIIEKVNKNIHPIDLHQSVVSHFSRTFRHRLRRSLNIYINDTKVEAYDFFLEKYRTKSTLLAEEVKTFDTFVDEKKVKGKVKVIVYALPMLSQMEMKNLGININTQGGSIIRNGRELAHNVTLNLFNKHNHANRLRFEVHIPDTMDEYFGINLQKSGFNGRFYDFEEFVREMVGPVISKAIERFKKDSKARINANAGAKNLDKIIGKAERSIESRSSYFKVRNLERMNPEIKGVLDYRFSDENKELVEFTHAAQGEEAMAFTPKYLGNNKLHITVNTDHAMFKKYSKNSADKKLLMQTLMAVSRSFFLITDGQKSTLKHFVDEFSKTFQYLDTEKDKKTRKVK